MSKKTLIKFNFPFILWTTLSKIWIEPYHLNGTLAIWNHVPASCLTVNHFIQNEKVHSGIKSGWWNTISNTILIVLDKITWLESKTRCTHTGKQEIIL